jgi:hypothetical protein
VFRCFGSRPKTSLPITFDIDASVTLECCVHSDGQENQVRSGIWDRGEGAAAPPAAAPSVETKRHLRLPPPQSQSRIHACTHRCASW